MPTKNPRIHVVLERPLFHRLKGLAKKNGFSMSLEARSLIQQALGSISPSPSRTYTGRHIQELIGQFKFDHHYEQMGLTLVS
ncbi:MAG: hypothetical protein HYS07_00390 [Chlamydiae bacterium]|nr:hypothetical protein [Chlamydiota bacterium]MBI3278117.1 hypothetical protein [Chlamydiota bacterium]